MQAWVPTEQEQDPEEPGSGTPLLMPSQAHCPFWLGQGWCRLVTAAYNYFHVTNFFWMFGEGCYLHTAIVLTYSTDRLRKWMFVCIGWGELQPRLSISLCGLAGSGGWGLHPC